MDINKQLRSFGFIVGGIFGVIASWPVVVRSDDPRWWALAIAGCLLVPAVVSPKTLLWPYRGWMWIADVLGWVNTRIILGAIFYLVVTPTGLIRRSLRKDPMGRQLRPDLDSYRIVRTPRPASHLTKQY